MDLDLVRELEDCALSALPAGHTVYDDGWIVRTSGGQTGRNNAVVAVCAGRDPLAAKIERVESFYRRLGRPALFYLSPVTQPPELPSVLDARGYGPRGSPVEVQIATLTATGLPRSVAATRVRVSARLTPPWMQAYAATHPTLSAADLAAKRAVMRAIRLPLGFAHLLAEGRAVAVGSAVCHGEWLGLFDIAVSPEVRAQGLGTALTHRLLAWGATQGARRAYLQVGADNGPAQRLYAKLGFARLYHYYYRQQRLTAGPA
jgi:ribosomal protein S18 acetylase RimI-like enzyme